MGNVAEVLDDPWKAAMQRGDFAAAWRVSDEVLLRRRASKETCYHWPRHLQYVWTGAPLAGKRVLVRCYHGLGDTIQFIRFTKPLRARARHVAVWVQPALIELLAGTPGVDEVLPLHDGVPGAEFDIDIEIMELPHALRIASIPAEVPYLMCPSARQRRHRSDACLQVGLVWKGGDWDTRRNVPLPLLQRLSNVSGVRLFSLQPGSTKGLPLPIVQADCSTIIRTAANMRELDLVISVDTMATHLAGALAGPVWTMLHAQCDWRWGRDGASSVWYPTMRLFRQRRPGDWLPVVEEVCAALAGLVTDKSRA